jgi:hypothetical protein
MLIIQDYTTFYKTIQHYTTLYNNILENTGMQKPSPYWQNIMFSEYEELKVVV